MKHRPSNDDGRAPGVRLQRVLAEAGVAARRICESMIREGRVSVNGRVVTSLPVFVDPVNDRIVADGRELPRASRTGASEGYVGRRVYVMLHKPARTIVSTADELGMDRRTVADLVKHPSGARLFPVGRLDYDATGLVLLTNDGELANRLSHPRFGVTKTYEVTVKGRLHPDAVAALEEELNHLQRRARRKLDPSRDLGRIAGSRPAARAAGTKAVEAALIATGPDKSLLEVTLHEARNRQVREMLAAAGLNVKHVARTAIGPLRLRELALGAWRELERDELRLLRDAAQGARIPPPKPRKATPGVLPPARRGPRTAAKPPSGVAEPTATPPTSESKPGMRFALPGTKPGAPARSTGGDLRFIKRGQKSREPMETERPAPARPARPSPARPARTGPARPAGPGSARPARGPNRSAGPRRDPRRPR